MMKRFTPKLDKLYWITLLITNALCIPLALAPFFEPKSLFITIPVLVFVEYFFVSPLFGYVELGEDHIIVKYGFFLKRCIKYSDIRAVIPERSVISESVFSLKSSLDHLRIKYNRFDYTIVSVKDNEDLLEELNKRI